MIKLVLPKKKKEKTNISTQLHQEWNSLVHNNRAGYPIEQNDHFLGKKTPNKKKRIKYKLFSFTNPIQRHLEMEVT